MQGKARQGEAGRGEAIKAWQGEAGWCRARQGEERRGEAWRGEARCGKAKRVESRRGEAW